MIEREKNIESKRKISPKYSVVIPVYNSSASLGELVLQISCIFNVIGQEYEVIMIDDGSSDDSWEKLRSLRLNYPQMNIVKLGRNYGQHNAIMCGLNYAKGDYIVTLDDDLQIPPSEIPKLIDKIEDGYQVVYGLPLKKQHSGGRNLGSTFIQFIYRKTFQATNNISSFRIIQRSIIKEVIKYDKNFVFIDGLLAWNTKNMGCTQVYHVKRKFGKTNYSLRSLMGLAMNMLTNFSVIPLRLASVLGFLFSLVGLLSTVYFMFLKLFRGIPVMGYASTITIITFFSGIQLLVLGLIGEYLGRVYLSINAKPQYTVEKAEIVNE